MKLFKLFIPLLLIGATLPLFSQTGEENPQPPPVIRSLGDKALSLNIGLFIPLFLQDSQGDITSFTDRLTLGPVGSLEWSGYLNKQMTLGGQLSGMFAFTPNNRIFSMIPLTVKYSFILDSYPLTIPFSLMAGISFNNLNDLFQLTPIIKPGFAFFWHLDAQWALGLNLAYWWVPEYHGDGELKDHSRFGSFLELSFSLLTHF